MDLSIVLPTLNEAKNISILIPQLEDFFSKKVNNFEIVVVDDKSPDGTADVAKNLNKKFGNIKVIVKEKREGLGEALRVAYNECEGDAIFSLDADLAFEFSDISNLFDEFNKGFDFVAGSRYDAESSYKKHSVYLVVKSVISFFGNKFSSFVLGVPLKDFSLNFRIMKTSAWKSINTNKKNNDFLMEVIYCFAQSGYSLSEVNVTFKPRIYGESKTSVPKQMFFFIKSLFDLRLGWCKSRLKK